MPRRSRDGEAAREAMRRLVVEPAGKARDSLGDPAGLNRSPPEQQSERGHLQLGALVETSDICQRGPGKCRFRVKLRW